MDKEEITIGLKAGRTLIVDRKDAPELPMLLEMVQQGLIIGETVHYDEQSSAIKFRWNHDKKIAAKTEGQP